MQNNVLLYIVLSKNEHSMLIMINEYLNTHVSHDIA